MMSIQSLLRLMAGTAALALSLHAGASTYTLTGTATDGSLTGTTLSGSFTVDDTLVAALDGTIGNEYIDLSSYSFSFDGVTYDASLADYALAAVYYNGVFIGLSGSFNSYDFSFVGDFGDASLNYFIYASGEGTGDYTITEVPEPASLALSLAALGGMGVVMRRRKQGRPHSA